MDQVPRLNYTQRDADTLDDEMTKYIKEFIPRITDASKRNSGRMFLTAVQGLIDNANYSIDQSHLESILQNARQRKNLLAIAYALDYNPVSVASGSVDATFSMLAGVAPVGGQGIPIYTRGQSYDSVEFLTTEAGTILEGEVSVDIPMIQGIRVVDESLTVSASGASKQVYDLGNAKTPHSLIEIKVDGIAWTRTLSWYDSTSESQHFRLYYDEDDQTYVEFGDGEFGYIPGSGATITATYIYTLADQGNLGATTIRRVVGSLASIVGVTNVEAVAGGAVSETNDSIKINAPAYRRSSYRIVSRIDHETHAKVVEGVYDAYAVHQEGSRTNVYILPDGGGVASSYLIAQVQARFNERKLDGATPVAYTLAAADILLTANIVTYNTTEEKPSIKRKVTEAIEAALVYTELRPGRGFAISDIAGVIENVGGGGLVDYTDFILLSRVPRVQKSNTSAPDMISRIAISSLAEYAEFVVTAVSTTEFMVAKSGVPESSNGTVATEYTTADGDITFTLGEVSDTFTIGDTWRFKTSKYVGNMYLDSDEFMRLASSADLILNAYYPAEYSIADI